MTQPPPEYSSGYYTKIVCIDNEGEKELEINKIYFQYFKKIGHIQ